MQKNFFKDRFTWRRRHDHKNVSISIIQSNLQLAFEADRPKRFDRYLQEIVEEIDTIWAVKILFDEICDEM
ncbi:hypothetical protein L9W92_09105 [Pelotomaculum terephthalicicum JT]|uniref:hypothetical protein n=1 Tax=Pelotomaculum TaxID=191373 RepID=UPI001F048A07|nr:MULTISPECIES: hypothetical protein [Pelotomaculum]MCG9968208.1 hypothetical protein [Pelotomaculum terephthalicicum JT]